MICAETATYTLCGLLCGLATGLPIHKRFYESFVTAYFGQAWEPQILAVIVIVVFIIIASVVAVYAPSRRIKNMAVVEVIANECFGNVEIFNFIFKDGNINIRGMSVWTFLRSKSKCLCGFLHQKFLLNDYISLYVDMVKGYFLIIIFKARHDVFYNYIAGFRYIYVRF